MILFDHIRRCGGQTVCHHLRELHPNHYQLDPANPNRSIREFAAMPERERYSFDLVCGIGAITLRNWARPNLVPMTVLRDPVDRVLSLYRHIRTERRDHSHLLCKSYSVRRCIETVPGFSNHYARHFRPLKYRFVFTSPAALLSACGFRGEPLRLGVSEDFDHDPEGVEAVRAANALDIEIFVKIASGAKLGRATISGGGR